MNNNELVSLKEALKNLHLAVKNAGLVWPLLVQIRPVSTQTYTEGVLIGFGVGASLVTACVEYVGYGLTVDGALSALERNALDTFKKAEELRRVTNLIDPTFRPSGT